MKRRKTDFMASIAHFSVAKRTSAALDVSDPSDNPKPPGETPIDLGLLPHCSGPLPARVTWSAAAGAAGVRVLDPLFRGGRQVG